MLKGLKTILFGLLLAIAPVLMTYFEGLKTALEQCVSVPSAVVEDVAGASVVVATEAAEICSLGLPTWALSVIGVIVLGLRFVTTTSVFKKT